MVSTDRVERASAPRVLDRHGLRHLRAARLRRGCRAPTASTARSMPTRWPRLRAVAGHARRRSMCGARRRRSRDASEDYFLVSIQTRGPAAGRPGRARGAARARRLRALRQHAAVRAALRRDLRAVRAEAAGPDLRTALRETERLTATPRPRRARRRPPDDRHDPDAGRRHRHARARVGRRGGRERHADPDRRPCRALPAARQPPVSHLTAYHREQIKACALRASRSRPGGRADRARSCACRRARCTAPGRASRVPRRMDLGPAARCGAPRAVRSGQGKRSVSEIAFALRVQRCRRTSAAPSARASAARRGSCAPGEPSARTARSEKSQGRATARRRTPPKSLSIAFGNALSRGRRNEAPAGRHKIRARHVPVAADTRGVEPT